MDSIMTPSGPVALLARNLCHVSWTKADRWRASVLFAAFVAGGSDVEEALKNVYKQIILEQNVGYHYC